MIPPRRLLISGGGIKVTAVVGAVKTLHDLGHLDQLKEACGVSAGAWMAFMIACKTPMEVIKRLLLEIEFGVVRNLKPESMLAFPETFGIDDGRNFVKLLESVFRLVLKIDPNLTFADMKSDIAFRCWATDVVTLKSREFSVKATPKVRIIDAIRATTAIPIYFTPFIDPETGNMLSDGGIQGNLPLQNFSDIEISQTLCIGFTSPAQCTSKNPEDVMGFMNSVFSCLIHTRNQDLLELWNHHIIRIPIDNYPSWNFEASREDREMLMNLGSNTVVKWLAKPSAKKISRRHSFQ